MIRRSSGSLRSPDRFLPNTSPLDALSQRCHTYKEANKLSTTEKLLRRDIASIDAFSPRRRATSPTSLTASPTPEQLSRSLHLGGEAERLVTISTLK
jgi:meiosis-specific APC/C activator protein AMA1